MWGLLACAGDVVGVDEGALLARLVGEGLGRWVALLGEQAVIAQRESAPARRGLTPPDTTIRGVVKLLGGVWEIEIQPEHGGRIISLRLAGEELLDQGIGVDDPSAEGFVAAGAWGWDEMVPNVEPTRYPGPGPFEGVELPDHGEAWRLPWTIVDDSTLECRGRVLPWKLTRRIVLTDSVVRIAYTYTNAGDATLYAYWCAHPLFRY